MSRRGGHDREGARDEVIWDVLVKQVAHRVYKDAARLPPPVRQVQAFRVQHDLGE